MEAVILIGIQGAGKTTFYQEKFAATHTRISLDLQGTRARERACLEECIAAERDFAVDNTNVLKRERAVYIAAAREAGFIVSGYFFKPNLRGSIGRNNYRKDKKPLPAPAVVATFKRLEPPELGEGFDDLSLVEPGLSPGQFLVTRL